MLERIKEAKKKNSEAHKQFQEWEANAAETHAKDLWNLSESGAITGKQVDVGLNLSESPVYNELVRNNFDSILDRKRIENLAWKLERAIESWDLEGQGQGSDT